MSDKEIDVVKTANFNKLAERIQNLTGLKIYEDGSFSFELTNENGDAKKIEYTGIPHNDDLKKLCNMLGYIDIATADKDNEITVIVSESYDYNHIRVLNHGKDVTKELFGLADDSYRKIVNGYLREMSELKVRYSENFPKFYYEYRKANNSENSDANNDTITIDLNAVLSEINTERKGFYGFEELEEYLKKSILDIIEKYGNVRSITIEPLDLNKISPKELLFISNFLHTVNELLAKYNNINDKENVKNELESMPLYDLIVKSGFRFTSNPEVVCNPEINKDADVMINLQQQQNEMLTSQEKESLILYKSSLYSIINSIVRYVRSKGISLDEAMANDEYREYIMTMLKQSYATFNVNQKEDVEAGVFTSADMPVAMKNIFSRYKDYLLTEEQYNDLVLTSIGQIESALSKCKLSEDIVVYRGIADPTKQLNWDHGFVSTSLSFEVAKGFTKETDRGYKGNLTPEVTQIVIPKGSNVICYGNSLFRKDNSIGFVEPQKEILIDIDQYEAICTYSNVDRINFRLKQKNLEKELNEGRGR